MLRQLDFMGPQVKNFISAYIYIYISPAMFEDFHLCAVQTICFSIIQVIVVNSVAVSEDFSVQEPPNLNALLDISSLLCVTHVHWKHAVLQNFTCQ